MKSLKFFLCKRYFYSQFLSFKLVREETLLENQYQVSLLIQEDTVAGTDEIRGEEHKSIWWTGVHHDFIRRPRSCAPMTQVS